jgi:hypothetical protein
MSIEAECVLRPPMLLALADMRAQNWCGVLGAMVSAEF